MPHDIKDQLVKKANWPEANPGTDGMAEFRNSI